MYKQRLIDNMVEKYLEVFGAISIEDLKWCGKTWTSSIFLNLSFSRSIPCLDSTKVLQ